MPGSPDGQRAHDVLLSYEPLSNRGACWYYVWQAYAACGAWTGQGSTPTALAAWNATSGKHPGDRNPPPGAAIWLGRRYSDGNMDGDVFIAGQYDGDHSATDQTSWGQTGVTSIQGRQDLCGREYLGWSDHVLDCPIRLGGTPPPTEDDVVTQDEMVKIAQQVWSYKMSGGDKNDPNAVPSETGGERLRQIRRSTDGLKHRTTDTQSTVNRIDGNTQPSGVTMSRSAVGLLLGLLALVVILAVVVTVLILQHYDAESLTMAAHAWMMTAPAGP